MGQNVADLFVHTLVRAGVTRVWGLPGDSLNGFTDAIRRSGELDWMHVRHEEAAAFAAAGEAHVTGELAVVARQLRSGQPAPHQRPLRRATAAACRCWRSPRTSRARRSASSYFQETHPQELFRECSVYVELVGDPAQLPRVLEIAMRTAVEKRGVAVVVVPGDIFHRDAPKRRPSAPIRATRPRVLPSEDELAAAAGLLNDAGSVTILAGAGVAGAHDEVMALAERPAGADRARASAARSTSSTTTPSTSG